MQSSFTSADPSTGTSPRATSPRRRSFATTSTAKASSGSWTRSPGTCRSSTHQWSLQQLPGERQVCALASAVGRQAAVWFFKVAHVPQLLWVRCERVFKNLLDVSKSRTPLPLAWPDQGRQLGRQLLLLVHSFNENRDLACSACCVFCRKQNMPEGGLGRGGSWAIVKSCISKGLHDCVELLLSLAFPCERQENHPYFWKSAVFWE